MNTTPYREATLLCINWLEKNSVLSRKFPSRGLNAACREYDLLHAVVLYYESVTDDKGNQLIDDELQEYYQRVLNFSRINEQTIIANLTANSEDEPQQMFMVMS